MPCLLNAAATAAGALALTVNALAGTTIQETDLFDNRGTPIQRVWLEYRPDGLRCVIEVPAEEVSSYGVIAPGAQVKPLKHDTSAIAAPKKTDLTSPFTMSNQSMKNSVKSQ